ncbi:MAG: helix-turn-helix domain-containing protein [Gammaproteobacteria bacterium]|jgi:transcriptional regulator GlxA family with amidase domain|nr:helix-turn-helix domain-containing protein [Gammaproteobacteria bacterium]
MLNVSVIGYRKVLGTSITIPIEMLNAADLINRIDGKSKDRLFMQLVSMDGSNIKLNAGLELVCNKSLADIQNTDMIILPALWGNPLGVVRQYPELIQWLREQQSKDTIICAAGTGSYFLAEVGLLNNKVATTHWHYFDQFSHTYPEVHLQRDRFITKAGNIYCAGSVNSMRDVMLHFIENYFSQPVADQVSRHFTHEIKRSYTSSFLKNSPQNYHDDENIIEIQEWMHSCYNDEITLESISEKFSISIRSLNRRFKQATEKSPMQYLQQVRIENAQELLKTSNLSIAEVAYSVGYPDNSYFSALFRKSISVTPKEYRNLVRKKLFKVNT